MIPISNHGAVTQPAINPRLSDRASRTISTLAASATRSFTSFFSGCES